MEELRLPWNNRDGILYGGVIAIITATIMCEFNLCRTMGGMTVETFMNGLATVPLLVVIVMLLMTFIVGRVADMFVHRFTMPGDSFYTKIVFNIIACVLMMSMIMTVVGPTVGHLMEGVLTAEPIFDWPVNWPVNFCVAFWVEMLIAQPAARYVMKHRHIRVLKSTEASA